jgi:hypothetical protein
MHKMILVISIILFVFSSSAAQSFQTASPSSPSPAVEEPESNPQSENVEALSKQEKPPHPEDAEKPHAEPEDAEKPDAEPEVKSRGFDPCLVNPNLPACK